MRLSPGACFNQSFQALSQLIAWLLRSKLPTWMALGESGCRPAKIQKRWHYFIDALFICQVDQRRAANFSKQGCRITVSVGQG